tara:strand:- start:3973 stop:4092 length:120 start_codon:yes stop_codon:yes gene_type:complete
MYPIRSKRAVRTARRKPVLMPFMGVKILSASRFQYRRAF